MHSDASQPLARQLVRTGDQEVEVSDLQVALRDTKAIVTSRKGYVESSTVREDDEADLRLRVPAAVLDETLEALAGLGKETYRRVNVDDVTLQALDLEAELTNLKTLRDRLRILLARAENVEAALKVEKELAKVQARIDSLEGKLRTLRSQVSYSRLDLSLQRRRIPGPLGAAGKGVKWGVRKLFVLN